MQKRFSENLVSFSSRPCPSALCPFLKGDPYSRFLPQVRSSEACISWIGMYLLHRPGNLCLLGGLPSWTCFFLWPIRGWEVGGGRNDRGPLWGRSTQGLSSKKTCPLGRWVCGGRVSWELPSDSSEECSQAPGGERMGSHCSHASGEQDRKGNHRAGETKEGSLLHCLKAGSHSGPGEHRTETGQDQKRCERLSGPGAAVPSAQSVISCGAAK